MYETMRFWQDPPPDPPYARDYAEMWQRAYKVVYSRTLDAATTPRTRIEREFAAEAVRELKAASGHDLSVGGAELAGVALEAGLVDEVHLFAVPVVVGGGKPAFRQGGTRLELELLDARRFGNGTTYSRYAALHGQ